MRAHRRSPVLTLLRVSAAAILCAGALACATSSGGGNGDAAAIAADAERLCASSRGAVMQRLTLPLPMRADEGDGLWRGVAASFLEEGASAPMRALIDEVTAAPPDARWQALAGGLGKLGVTAYACDHLSRILGGYGPTSSEPKDAPEPAAAP